MAAVMFRRYFFKTYLSLSTKEIGTAMKYHQKLCKVMTVVSKLQCQCYNTTVILMKTKKDMKFKIINDKKIKMDKVNVWLGITVKELAKSASKDVNDVIEALFYKTQSRYMSNDILDDSNVINQTVKALGLLPIYTSNPHMKTKFSGEKKIINIRSPPPDPSVLIKRRPIVTIMGHVDHGKTTLLDTLRNTSVVTSEFGGITQHIGAFNVTLNSGETITFLDTPGHAAFSSMRLRGAHVTDIIVLVVAADDGVMEQTIESIEMAKKANVPIIVAINKIDKPEANIEKTQNMLLQYGIYLENLGGEIQSVNISALKNINLDQLMEAICAQAEIMDLKGDPTGQVEGVIIESSTDSGRGKLATVLIKRGTLMRGNYIVSGTAWAKVRAMFDHMGNVIKQGTLCDPVQVIGWRQLPNVGDEILQVKNEKIAHIVVHKRLSEKQYELAINHQRASEEKMQNHLIEYKKQLQLKRSLGLRWLKKERTKETEPDDGIAKLNIIIKADVAGSVEAILDTLDTYKEEKKCRLNIVHYGVGQINETDIELSETFNAIIYCFNIKGAKNIKKQISERVRIRHFNVIYKLIDDLKEEIINLLPSVIIEDVIGEADVLKEFEINEKRNKIKVAGCICSKGELKKMANFKLIRNNEVIYTGKLKSMRHLKQEVNSIKNGTECGLMLDNPEVSFQLGDKIICFMNREERAKLRWNTGF